MKNKTKIIIIIIIILFIFIMFYNVIQKNQLENEVIELNQKIEQIEQEKENITEIESKNKTNENVDTLDEDIEWFVTKVYTLENRKELYEDIKVSTTEDVLKGLFGEDLPPEENQGEVHSVDRNIKNINVYGKYENENHYKAMVTFDLIFDSGDKTDSAFTVMQVDLTQKDDSWKVDNIEEYAKGERQ